jgi:hypothetical protein
MTRHVIGVHTKLCLVRVVFGYLFQVNHFVFFQFFLLSISCLAQQCFDKSF